VEKDSQAAGGRESFRKKRPRGPDNVPSRRVGKMTQGDGKKTEFGGRAEEDPTRKTKMWGRRDVFKWWTKSSEKKKTRGNRRVRNNRQWGGGGVGGNRKPRLPNGRKHPRGGGKKDYTYSCQKMEKKQVKDG